MNKDKLFKLVKMEDLSKVRFFAPMRPVHNLPFIEMGIILSSDRISLYGMLLREI